MHSLLLPWEPRIFYFPKTSLFFFVYLLPVSFTAREAEHNKHSRQAYEGVVPATGRSVYYRRTAAASPGHFMYRLSLGSEAGKMK